MQEGVGAWTTGILSRLSELKLKLKLKLELMLKLGCCGRFQDRSEVDPPSCDLMRCDAMRWN